MRVCTLYHCACVAQVCSSLSFFKLFTDTRSEAGHETCSSPSLCDRNLNLPYTSAFYIFDHFFLLKIVTRVNNLDFTRQAISRVLITRESSFHVLLTRFEPLYTSMYLIGLSDGTVSRRMLFTRESSFHALSTRFEPLYTNMYLIGPSDGTVSRCTLRLEIYGATSYFHNSYYKIEQNQ